MDLTPRPDQTPPTPSAPLVDSMTAEPQRYTRRGNPIVPADPGSAGSRPVALIAAIVFAILAIGWQNLPVSMQRKLVMAPPEQVLTQTADMPAPGGMSDMMARVYLKLMNWDPMRTSFESDPRSAAQSVQQIGDFGSGDADKVRTIIAAAELLGPERALEDIETLRLELLNVREPDPDTSEEQLAADEAAEQLVLEELDILEAIYTTGPEILTQDDRDQLSARYSKLGDQVLTWGQDDETRKAVLGSPALMITVMFLAIVLVGGGFLVGLAVLVYGLIWYTNRRTRMHNPVPEPGGSVMLETYAAFVGAFFLYVVLATAAQFHAPSLGAFALPAQWVLILVPMWPLLRGMRSRRWRHALGITRGRGIFREIGAGIVAYAAAIPVYVLGVVVTFVAVVIWEAIKHARSGQASSEELPTNPIVDMLATGDWTFIIMIFALATIWAPITEELIFRGALFRHLRSRMWWPVAAMISALLFAYMHSYGPLFVGPLVALGFMFAFMREWRGSIIAPVVGHFIHNFSVLTMLLLLLISIN